MSTSDLFRAWEEVRGASDVHARLDEHLRAANAGNIATRSHSGSQAAPDLP